MLLIKIPLGSQAFTLTQRHESTAFSAMWTSVSTSGGCAEPGERERGEQLALPGLDQHFIFLSPQQ